VLALPADTRLMILAPVAREKKGEFLDLFAEMQAQGYVRSRINGKTFEFDDLPALKKTEKHDIDVVIDRIKVRAAPVQAQPAVDHATSVAARTDYDSVATAERVPVRCFTLDPSVKSSLKFLRKTP